MPRIPQLSAETSTDEQKQLLDATLSQLGRVPNLYAAMASSPSALRGYLALREALVSGVFSVVQREQLALFVAQENACTYCVSAHSLRGSKVGLSQEQLRATRAGEAEDAHMQQVLTLTGTILRSGGRVDDDELRQARAAGVTDAELTEIVAHVALNVFSNYFNHVAQPELDFPSVHAAPAAR